MNERRVDEHRFEGSGGRKGRNCWMNGAIINRFPRQCAEARKVRRGEVEKRKEETRRDASPRYAYVLAHGERRVFLFGHRRHPAAWRNTLTELTRNCTLHFDSAAHNTLLLLTIARGIVSLVSQPESLPFQRHCNTKRFSLALPPPKQSRDPFETLLKGRLETSKGT